MNDCLQNERVFSGEFRHGLDPKGRITVPACWRSGEEEEFFCIPDASKLFLRICPPSEHKRIVAAVESSPALTPAQRKQYLRWFHIDHRWVRTDRQGRLLVPENHRRAVGLEGEVVLAGSGRQIEIWPPAAFDEARRQQEETVRLVEEVAGI